MLPVIRILRAAAQIAGTLAIGKVIDSAISAVENFFKSDTGQGLAMVADATKSALLVGHILHRHGIEGVRAYHAAGVLSDAEMLLAIGVYRSAHIPTLPVNTFDMLEATASTNVGSSSLDVEMLSNDPAKLLRLSSWLQTNLRAQNLSL